MFYEIMSYIWFFGIVAALFYGEQKMKRKEEYHGWICEERFRIKSISENFRSECEKEIEDYIKYHNENFVGRSLSASTRLDIRLYFSNYKELNSKLAKKKEWYEANFSSLYEKKYKRINEETYPQFLVNEYIEEISNVYSQINFTMDLLRIQIECAENRRQMLNIMIDEL